jgi:hypothetical protein
MFGDDVKCNCSTCTNRNRTPAAQPVIGVFNNVKIVTRKYKAESGIFEENNSFEYANEEGDLFVQTHTPESE